MEMSSNDIDEITAERNDGPARLSSAINVYTETYDRWVSRARATDTAPRGVAISERARAGDVGRAPSRADSTKPPLRSDLCGGTQR